MAYLFSGLCYLLSFTSLIFLFIGFFKPEVSLFWLKGQRTRGKSALIYFFGMVVLSLIGGSILASKFDPKTAPIPTQEPPKAEQPKAEQPKAGYDIIRLLNEPTSVFDSIFGKPTESKTVKNRYPCEKKTCDFRAYKDGEVEVYFDKNKSKRVTINNPKDLVFGENVLQKLGLPQSKPTFSNEFICRWSDLSGLKQLQVTPGGDGTVAMIVIDVIPDYDGKEFGTANPDVVQVQNSAWDGSVSQVEKYLKSTLNDKDSYEGVEWGQVITANEKGYRYQVKHKFRAANGFGAKVLNVWDFYLDKYGNVVDVKQ